MAALDCRSHSHPPWCRTALRCVCQLLVSVSVVLLMRTVRQSEGPVFQSLPPLPAALQSLVQRGQPCPLFYLYLSQVCLCFESKELQAAVRSLKKSFSAPPSRSLSDAAVKKISARMSESAQLLLGRYVEIHALNLQRNIMQQQQQQHRHTHHTAATATATVTTESSTEKSFPSCISSFVEALHDRLLCIQVETSELIPKKRAADDKPSSKTATAQLSLSSARSAAAHLPSSRSAASSSAASGLAGRDFARLFSARVATFASVRMNRVDVLVAVLRVVFQCWIEHVRQCHFHSASSLQQVELDVTAVRQCVLPQPVQYDDLDEQQRLIHSQLDEVSHSAMERCSDDVAAAVHSLSNQHIDALLGRFQQQQQQYRA